MRSIHWCWDFDPQFIYSHSDPRAQRFVDVTGDGRDDIMASAVGANSSSGDRIMYLLGNVAPKPGDYNGDGTVDVADYQTWKAAFGTTVAAPGDGADGNGDGGVDAADYTVWRNNLAMSADFVSQQNRVPEPSTAWLLGIGIILVTLRRARVLRSSANSPSFMASPPSGTTRSPRCPSGCAGGRA
jgi:hypothetical protein